MSKSVDLFRFWSLSGVLTFQFTLILIYTNTYSFGSFLFILYIILVECLMINVWLKRYIHTHTSHTHIYTHLRTYIYTRTHTHTYTRTHAHTHTYTHTISINIYTHLTEQICNTYKYLWFIQTLWHKYAFPWYDHEWRITHSDWMIVNN